MVYYHPLKPQGFFRYSVDEEENMLLNKSQVCVVLFHHPLEKQNMFQTLLVPWISHELFHEPKIFPPPKKTKHLPHPPKNHLPPILYQNAAPLFCELFPCRTTHKTGPFRKLPALLLTVLKSFVVIESLGEIIIPQGMQKKLETFGWFQADMGVSGISIINHPFWGTPIFGNTHMEKNKFGTVGQNLILSLKEAGVWRIIGVHKAFISFCLNSVVCSLDISSQTESFSGSVFNFEGSKVIFEAFFCI